VILPDNDEPGLKHAHDVESKLSGIAKRIRILELPGLPEKGDVSDWVAAGGTREKLLELVVNKPNPASSPR
jgi:putative DNA primase/helicase